MNSLVCLFEVYQWIQFKVGLGPDHAYILGTRIWRMSVQIRPSCWIFPWPGRIFSPTDPSLGLGKELESQLVGGVHPASPNLEAADARLGVDLVGSFWEPAGGVQDLWSQSFLVSLHEDLCSWWVPCLFVGPSYMLPLLKEISPRGFLGKMFLLKLCISHRVYQRALFSVGAIGRCVWILHTSILRRALNR